MKNIVYIFLFCVSFVNAQEKISAEAVVQKQVEVVETAYEEVLSTLSKKNKKNK